MQIQKMITLAFTIAILCVSCSAQKNANSGNENQRGQRGGGAPSVAKIFEMDANGDGKLAKSEIKGRLLNDFDRIDTDNDGFISITEMEAAPKPERGQGGQRPPRQ